MTDYKRERLDSFIRYMVKCFGIRWHSVCDKQKIKYIKRIYYCGYNDRGES
jgi:hypothetical protein